jgi:hypothetical protein
MPIQDLTADQIDSLVGTRHPGTGIEYPPDGLQPYYYWLIRALHLLAESSLGALRVTEDDSSSTAIQITPGRVTVSGVVLDFTGETNDLSAFNNDTVYVWLRDNAGVPGIGINAASGGWPGISHIKLAEVTIAAGAITGILDRRLETVFSV